VVDLLAQYQGAFVRAKEYSLAGLDLSCSTIRTNGSLISLKSLLANSNGSSPSSVNQLRTDDGQHEVTHGKVSRLADDPGMNRDMPSQPLARLYGTSSDRPIMLLYDAKSGHA
jgi:hypothetical protein